MKKPHIKKIWGCWFCYKDMVGGKDARPGFSPRSAYLEWLAYTVT